MTMWKKMLDNLDDQFLRSMFFTFFSLKKACLLENVVRLKTPGKSRMLVKQGARGARVLSLFTDWGIVKSIDFCKDLFCKYSANTWRYL